VFNQIGASKVAEDVAGVAVLNLQSQELAFEKNWVRNFVNGIPSEWRIMSNRVIGLFSIHSG
jgi:hypothetical protein